MLLGSKLCVMTFYLFIYFFILLFYYFLPFLARSIQAFVKRLFCSTMYS